ncbi:MAG: hypothetical protein NVS9B15_08220 [Acidobacteriaceae bacterium]
MAYAQQTLATYRKTSRVLLVFAPGDRDRRYRQQLTQLADHHADLHERDVVVLPIFLRQGMPVASDTLHAILGPGLPDDEQVVIRRRFGVAPKDFAVLLLGKDGGEKYRSAEPISIDHLDHLIDAMPMRQQEMHPRQH